MTDKERVKVSKLLSLGLRHQPDAIGIKLDKNGWADVSAVIAGMRTKGYTVSQADIRDVVETSDKKRFALSDDGRKIRANQGHSVKEVDLELQPAAPPAVLYHGTPRRNVGGIFAEGLKKGSRQHVHLSVDTATAQKVGDRRRDETVIFRVDATQAHADGLVFFVSANGVWLTDAVPAKYLVVHND